MTNTIDLILSLYLHGIIMFSILSALFIFVISSLSKSHIQDEVDSLVKNIVKNFINPELKKQNIAINDSFKKKLINTINKPDEIATINNNYIYGIVITILIILITFYIFIYMILTYNNIEVDIVSIIIENLITFTFVGIIEGIFFYTVALKFIPVVPSMISKVFLNQIKQNL